VDFKEIDDMFEGALKRLSAKAGPGVPYGEPPLASDHFLLKRSWEYFRQRASAMEKEWKQILAAKEDEMKALQEILRLRDEQLAGLQGATKDSERIEEEFARAQLADQREFSDAARKLHETWEEEREALLRSADEASSRVQRIRAEAEHRVKAAETEMKNLRASLDKARAEALLQTEKRLEADGEAAKALSMRDELIRSLESKVDVLRSELDRRESAVKDLTGRLEERGKDLADLTARLSAAAAESAAKSDRIALLDEKLAAAAREIEELRAGWKREQAEWRELWDRSREMWEKKGGNPDFPSERTPK
jgi:chromosome segregation ATPase